MRRRRLTAAGATPEADFVAVEEPLEVRVRGQAIAVLLRLPGREADLVAGFLAAERVIAHPEDLAGVAPCLDPETGEAAPNVWNAALAEGVSFDPRQRRFGIVSSACGLCGAQSIEDLERTVPPLRRPPELGVAALAAAFRGLRASQPLFAATAGVHAAGLLPPGLELADVAEDVGRHNAVDKVLGARLRAGDYPLAQDASLLVSGRVAFEIVQKAALAGIGAVAGVGAPTSLAVAAAQRFGMALYGLVREESANRYA